MSNYRLEIVRVRQSLRTHIKPFVPIGRLHSCKENSPEEIRVVCSMSDEEVDAYPPWNFSWVIPGELAAMALPRNKENLQFLIDEGIKHLVTLSPEKQPPVAEKPALNWKLIAIEEFEAPTLKEIIEFVDFCTKCRLKGEPVGVHCRQGRGRTGVMLACYLMALNNLNPDRALTDIRLMRPGSCETEEQERAVRQYNDHLRSI